MNLSNLRVSFFIATPRDFKQILLRKAISEITPEGSKIHIQLPSSIQPTLELGKLGESNYSLVIKREFGYFRKEEVERLLIKLVTSNQDPVEFGQTAFKQV